LNVQTISTLRIEGADVFLSGVLNIIECTDDFLCDVLNVQTIS
jgi:hypothetical protein